jgi:hypothetical protein
VIRRIEPCADSTSALPLSPTLSPQKARPEGADADANADAITLIGAGRMRLGC